MTTLKTIDSSALIAEKASVEKEEEFSTSFHDCNKEIDVDELEYEVNEAIEELLRKDDEINMLKQAIALKNAKFSAAIDILLKSLILFIAPVIYVQGELERDDNNTIDNLRMLPFSLMGICCLSLFVHRLFAGKHVAWIW